MDKKIVYPAQVPLSGDFLQIQRNTQISLAYAMQAWSGGSTIADGLNCIPTTPASLAVQITPGSLCAVAALDQTAYGSLPADVTHQIMQQGISLDPVTLTLVAPLTSGQSINYLIQVQFQSADTDATVLAYFNSANPTVPFMGAANSGTAQPTTRRGIVAIQAKAGVAATSGTQATPSPDAGWTGLYSITVANGATVISSSQINLVTTAPFLSVKLPQVPAYTQNGAFAFGFDTGTANAMSVTLFPVPASNPVSIYVKKINTANSGAMTINVNALGSVPVKNADGSPLTSGQMAAGFMAHLVWDGSAYCFMNGTATTSVGALTASSGEGVTVASGGAVSLNYPALAANQTPDVGDGFAYYNNTDKHHRLITFSQLKTQITGALQAALRYGQGIYTPNAIDGDKGTDTANFKSLYLDGKLSVMPHVIVEDWHASGTYGQTLNNGYANTRILNTLVYNAKNLASLSNNQITLPAGTYYFKWSSQMMSGYENRVKSSIFNVTDNAMACNGEPLAGHIYYNVSGSNYMTTSSKGRGIVTIATEKTFELRMFCTASQGSCSGGFPCNDGTPEIYSSVEIWKAA